MFKQSNMIAQAISPKHVIELDSYKVFKNWIGGKIMTLS